MAGLVPAFFFVAPARHPDPVRGRIQLFLVCRTRCNWVLRCTQNDVIRPFCNTRLTVVFGFASERRGWQLFAQFDFYNAPYGIETKDFLCVL